MQIKEIGHEFPSKKMEWSGINNLQSTTYDRRRADII